MAVATLSVPSRHCLSSTNGDIYWKGHLTMNSLFPFDELKDFETRFVHKAQTCRHAAEGKKDDAFFLGEMHSLFAEGKQRGMNLWMCRSDYEPPVDLSLLSQLADWFDATAHAASLLSEAAVQTTNLLPYLQLAGKVNAHLGAMVAAVYDHRDADQAGLHGLLIGYANENSVFIAGLTIPEQAPTEDCLLRFLGQIEQGQKKVEAASSTHLSLHLLKRALKPIPETESQWQQVADQVSALIQIGTKPNNAQLRKALLPVFEFIPMSGKDTVIDSVIQEIDLYLSQNPAADAVLDNEPASPDVPKARQLLGGQRILLIGGQQRSTSQKRLIKGFALKDLVWLTVKPKQALIPFTKANLQDYGTVLLSLRFAGHLLDQAKEFCERTHTPLVLLPDGYNRNQIAEQILRQIARSPYDGRQSA